MKTIRRRTADVVTRLFVTSAFGLGRLAGLATGTRAREFLGG